MSIISYRYKIKAIEKKIFFLVMRTLKESKLFMLYCFPACVRSMNPTRSATTQQNNLYVSCNILETFFSLCVHFRESLAYMYLSGMTETFTTTPKALFFLAA